MQALNQLKPNDQIEVAQEDEVLNVPQAIQDSVDQFQIIIKQFFEDFRVIEDDQIYGNNLGSTLKSVRAHLRVIIENKDSLGEFYYQRVSYIDECLGGTLNDASNRATRVYTSVKKDLESYTKNYKSIVKKQPSGLIERIADLILKLASSYNIYHIIVDDCRNNETEDGVPYFNKCINNCVDVFDAFNELTVSSLDLILHDEFNNISDTKNKDLCSALKRIQKITQAIEYLLTVYDEIQVADNLLQGVKGILIQLLVFESRWGSLITSNNQEIKKIAKSNGKKIQKNTRDGILKQCANSLKKAINLLDEENETIHPDNVSRTATEIFIDLIKIGRILGGEEARNWEQRRDAFFDNRNKVLSNRIISAIDKIEENQNKDNCNAEVVEGVGKLAKMIDLSLCGKMELNDSEKTCLIYLALPKLWHYLTVHIVQGEIDTDKHVRQICFYLSRYISEAQKLNSEQKYHAVFENTVISDNAIQPLTDLINLVSYLNKKFLLVGSIQKKCSALEEQLDLLTEKKSYLNARKVIQKQLSNFIVLLRSSVSTNVDDKKSQAALRLIVKYDDMIAKQFNMKTLNVHCDTVDNEVSELRAQIERNAQELPQRKSDEKKVRKKLLSEYQKDEQRNQKKLKRNAQKRAENIRERMRQQYEQKTKTIKAKCSDKDKGKEEESEFGAVLDHKDKFPNSLTKAYKLLCNGKLRQAAVEYKSFMARSKQQAPMARLFALKGLAGCYLLNAQKLLKQGVNFNDSLIIMKNKILDVCDKGLRVSMDTIGYLKESKDQLSEEQFNDCLLVLEWDSNDFAKTMHDMDGYIKNKKEQLNRKIQRMKDARDQAKKKIGFKAWTTPKYDGKNNIVVSHFTIEMREVERQLSDAEVALNLSHNAIEDLDTLNDERMKLSRSASSLSAKAKSLI